MPFISGTESGDINEFRSAPFFVNTSDPGNFYPTYIPSFWLNSSNGRLFFCGRETINANGETVGVWTRIGAVSGGVGGAISIDDLQGGTATSDAGLFNFNGNPTSGILVSASGNTVFFAIRNSGITNNFLADNAVENDKISDDTIAIDKLTPALRTLIQNAGSGAALQYDGNDVTSVSEGNNIDFTFNAVSGDLQIASTASGGTTLQYNNNNVTSVSEGDNIDFTFDSASGDLQIASTASGGTTLQYDSNNVTSVSEGDNIDFTFDSASGDLQIASTASGGTTLQYDGNDVTSVSEGNDINFTFDSASGDLQIASTASGDITINSESATTITNSSTVEWTGTSPSFSAEVVDNSINDDKLSPSILARINNPESSYTLPTTLQDFSNHLTVRHVTDNTGTWQRVTPDPYADRVTITREFAVFENENKTSAGSNQVPGNVFNDITPAISVTTTDPQYFPTSSTSLDHTWLARTSYDREKVTVENSDSNITPIEDVFNKILSFDVYINNVTNYPTANTPLLILGEDDAHPMYTMQRVGNVVNIYVEQITSRSAGSTTYTYRTDLNTERLVIPGMVGGETQVFQNIPDDWDVDTDSIEFKFVLYRISSHETFFPEVVLSPTDSGFNITSLTTAVPETTFTVTFNVVDGQTPLTLSTTYHAEYRAVRNANGSYFIEISNASLTDNLGSDYEAHVFVGRASSETHGSVNNYTSTQIASLTSGQEITIVSSFFPNDDRPLSGDDAQSARLLMIYADSEEFNNDIDLDRARGDDGLDFSRLVYNDLTVSNASFVARMESYKYVGSVPPSHNELLMMWQNRGSYLGLFFSPTRNAELFDLSAEFNYVGKGDDGGGGLIVENKQVSTSSFTVTDAVPGTAATTTIADNTLFQLGTRGFGSGTQTIDGVQYTLNSSMSRRSDPNWMTNNLAVSSPNITMLLEDYFPTADEVTNLGWVGADPFNTAFSRFLLNGNIEFSNFAISLNSSLTILLQIVRGISTDSPTVIHSQLLTTTDFQTSTPVQIGDVIVLSFPSTVSTSSSPIIRMMADGELSDGSDPTAGDTTKTSVTSDQGFNELTFNNQSERDSVVSKASLLLYETRTVTGSDTIPFLFLERLQEADSFTVDDDTVSEFVNNPIFSIRESYLKTYEVNDTVNIRIIRTRGETATTIEDSPTFALRGTITGANDSSSNTISEPYYCVRVTDTVEDGDIYSIEGHTSKNIALTATGSSLMYNNQAVANITAGESITANYTSSSETLDLTVTNPTTIDTVELGDGTSITPSDRTIVFNAGDNVSLERDATNLNQINIGSTGGGGSSGSKDVSTSTFTTTDGTEGTAGTDGTYTTFQWYSDGRSRGVTVDYTATKEVGGVTYNATADAYTNQNANWETTSTSSSENIDDLFDIRGGGRRLYLALGYTDINAIRDLNDFNVNISSTGTTPLFIANFTPSTSTFPPTSSSNTQTVLAEIWRPTSNRDVYTLRFQQALTDTEYVRLPDIQSNDVFVIAFPSTAPTSQRATIRFRQQITAPVPGTDPTAGDTSKTATTTTETFDMLTFGSEIERDSIINKATLLSEEAHVVIDPEPLPFLFLGRTLEMFDVSVHDDDLTEFVNNPIFSLKESVYRSFLVDGTTNIRIMRTRNGVRSAVDDTLSFVSRGIVDNATSTNGDEVNEPYYCVRTNFDVQDNDIFEVEGHTRRHVSFSTLTFDGRDVNRISIGDGINAVYTPSDKRLDLSSITGFASFHLTFPTAARSGTDFYLRRADSSFNTYTAWRYGRVDISNSSVIASSYAAVSTTNPSFVSIAVSGRYNISVPATESALVVLPSTAISVLPGNRLFSRRTRPGINYSIYINKDQNLVFATTMVTYSAGLPNIESSYDDELIVMSTPADTEIDSVTEAWYSFTVSSYPLSNYVSTTMLDLGDTLEDVSSITNVSIRHVAIDTDNTDTSEDVSDIFNFISLTSAELTALNMTATGYTDAKIFFEFRKAGNFVMHGYMGSNHNYILHLRPTRSSGLVTGYTKLYSTFDSIFSDVNNQFDGIYFEAQQGDLLLLFTAGNTSTTISPDVNFSIGQVLVAEVNPEPTSYIKSQVKTVQTPLALGSRSVIDFDNSDANIANMFRHFLEADPGGGERSFLRTYNIARFEVISSANVSSTTGWLRERITGSNNPLETQVVNATSEAIGVRSFGLYSSADPTIEGEQTRNYLGINNLRLSSAEYDEYLIQDNGVTTHVNGFKYPNNGYSTTLSSSGITDLFSLRSLTQAEMRIITGESSGAFSATGNMVLEASLVGVITTAKYTTSASSVADGFIATIYEPTYTDNVLTAVSQRGRLFVGHTADSVTTVEADENGIWPSAFSPIKTGDLVIIRSQMSTGDGNTGDASAIAINFLQE